MKAIITVVIITIALTVKAQPPIAIRQQPPITTVPKVPGKIPKQLHIIPVTSSAFERTYAFHIDGDYLDVWIDDASVLHFSSNKNIDKRSITTYTNKADWMSKKGNEHIINTASPIKYGDTPLTTGEYKNMYAYVMTLHMVGGSTNYQTIFVRK